MWYVGKWLSERIEIYGVFNLRDIVVIGLVVGSVVFLFNFVYGVMKFVINLFVEVFC